MNILAIFQWANFTGALFSQVAILFPCDGNAIISENCIAIASGKFPVYSQLKFVKDYCNKSVKCYYPVLFRYVSVQNLTIHLSHFNKQVQMKIVANFKNGEVLGWAMTPQEMSQLHDIFEDITDKQENSKVRYVLQFYWRDLTSAFDLIGPYFTCQASVTMSAFSEMINQTMYALHKFCFKVCAMVCDGASTNLALLKILCGLPNKMLDINDCEGGNIRERYHKNFCFRNPFDVDDHPVFVIVCPSHQVSDFGRQNALRQGGF